ncbi:uncharacterized protein LOC142521274 [Primulina tabacum]|uniref:uncharacterized protein LOC142521274 n=1 Tax=Primulina tabacum TaxID=48773 RepID=UPI003F5A523F
MAPTPTIFNNNNVQIHSDESEAAPTFRPPSSARRNIIPSFATFSSTTSTTPCTSPPHFKGIPFSWEKIPGIPKYQESHKSSKSTRSLLPLPPAGNSVSAAAATKKDPFLVALMECSKDDHGTDLGHFWKGSSKNFITRTLSDRFGFISMYGSCKRGCAVSESVVYLPRSARSST